MSSTQAQSNAPILSRELISLLNCSGQLCRRLETQLDRLKQEIPYTGAEAASFPPTPHPSDTSSTSCCCLRTIDRFVTWVENQLANPEELLQHLQRPSVRALWLDSFVACISLTAPSPLVALLYGLGVFSTTGTGNITADKEEGTVKYPQQWTAQLEMHSRVVRLAGVIQGLAQSTGEDRAAFDIIIEELVLKIRTDLLSVADSESEEARQALVGSLALPFFRQIALTLLKEAEVMTALFDALEYEPWNVQWWTILLALGASTHRELVTELVTQAGPYLTTLTERAIAKVQRFIKAEETPLPLAILLVQNTDKSDDWPREDTPLEPHFLLQLVAAQAVVRLTITTRLFVATSDPGLPVSDTMKRPLVLPLKLVQMFRTLWLNIPATVTPTSNQTDFSGSSDHTDVTSYVGQTALTELCVDVCLYCLFDSSIRDMFVRDDQVWKRIVKSLDTPLAFLDHTSRFTGATLSPLLTHTWSLIRTITVFVEALTRYPKATNEDAKQAEKLRKYAQRTQSKDGSSSESSGWIDEASQQLTEAEVTQRLTDLQTQYPFVLKWWADISKRIMDCWSQRADLTQQCLGFPCQSHRESKSEGQTKLAIPFALVGGVLETITKVYVNLGTAPKLRPPLVQHGAVTHLLRTVAIGQAMIQRNNPKTGRGSTDSSPSVEQTDILKLGFSLKSYATHALAKLAISVNPNVAFSYGQARSLASVLVSLLKPATHVLDHRQQSTLMQFEVLLALTNLASMDISPESTGEITPVSTASDQPDVYDVDIRTYIAIVCGALTHIETLQLDSHPMVVRAATETLCNLMCSGAVFDQYVESCRCFLAERTNTESESQTKATGNPPPLAPYQRCKLHILVALTGSEDLATQSAASGALAILTSEPIPAEALAYHPRGPVALVELLGVECDPSNGPIPVDSTRAVGQGRYIEVQAMSADLDPGLMHRALECWKNILTALPAHTDVVQQWLTKWQLGALIKEVVQWTLVHKQAMVAQVGLEVLKLITAAE